MLCVVYQLRRRGEKLPPEEVRRHPVPGWLIFDKRGGSPVLDARLYDKKGGKELLVLEHAHLVKIDEGMMLRGFEAGGGYQKHYRQGWWVLPGPLDDLTTFTAARA